jgi:hypothetical protein
MQNNKKYLLSALLMSVSIGCVGSASGFDKKSAIEQSKIQKESGQQMSKMYDQSSVEGSDQSQSIDQTMSKDKKQIERIKAISEEVLSIYKAINEIQNEAHEVLESQKAAMYQKNKKPNEAEYKRNKYDPVIGIMQFKESDMIKLANNIHSDSKISSTLNLKNTKDKGSIKEQLADLMCIHSDMLSSILQKYPQYKLLDSASSFANSMTHGYYLNVTPENDPLKMHKININPLMLMFYTISRCYGSKHTTPSAHGVANMMSDLTKTYKDILLEDFDIQVDYQKGKFLTYLFTQYKHHHQLVDFFISGFLEPLVENNAVYYNKIFFPDSNSVSASYYLKNNYLTQQAFTKIVKKYPHSFVASVLAMFMINTETFETHLCETYGNAKKYGFKKLGALLESESKLFNIQLEHYPDEQGEGETKIVKTCKAKPRKQIVKDHTEIAQWLLYNKLITTLNDTQDVEMQKALVSTIKKSKKTTC